MMGYGESMTNQKTAVETEQRQEADKDRALADPIDLPV